MILKEDFRFREYNVKLGYNSNVYLGKGSAWVDNECSGQL